MPVDLKSVLDPLVSAGRMAYKLDAEMRSLGYANTPYADLFGEIADGIFFMISDREGDFFDSATFRFLTNEHISEEQCVCELMDVYNRNSVGMFNLSKNAEDIVREVAASRNVSVGTMTRLIINEWALRQHFIRNLKAV